MQFLEISQYDAAVRQTNAAIRMYLNQEDPVAIHTVSCAALGVLDKLLEHEGKQSMQQNMRSYIVEDRQDEVIKKLRESQNFFKHGADRDKTVKFNPDFPESIIMVCCLAFDFLGVEYSKEMSVFQLGLAANHPNLLKEGDYKDKVNNLRGSLPKGKPFITKPELLQLLRKLKEYQA